MKAPVIFESETNFCMIMWEYEPVTGGAMVKLCEKKLGWKKSTVYTVIKRLAQRGVISFENGVVTALVTKRQYAVSLLNDIKERYFDGDLDALIRSASSSEKERKGKKAVTTANSLPQEFKAERKRAVVATKKNANENVAVAEEKSGNAVEKASRMPSFLL